MEKFYWKRMTAKAMPFLCIALLLAVVSAGCQKPQSQDDSGSTLTLGAFVDFKQGSATEGQSLVFDTLTGMSEQMDVLPNIIASWDTNEDCSEYTLKIQPDVTFSDGTPLTAGIVKYSLEAWAPYRDGSFMYYLDSIDVVDDLTLAVKLQSGYGNLLIEMSRLYVSLPGSLDDRGNVINWIGTGPFILDEYQLEQSALLKTNKNYWNKKRTPKIDALKWLVIPDENARLMALQSGEVDALGVSEHYCAMPYSKVAELKAAGEFNVDFEQRLGLVATYVYNYRQGPMTDINLRKAVTLAIDREAIANTIFFGVSRASGDFMPRNVKYGPVNETEYVFDPVEAGAALQAGGYTDTDGDGFVEKNGKPVVLKFVVESAENSRTMAVFVQDCLRRIGINSALEALDDAAYSDKVATGDFDICYTHPWLTTPQTYMSWRGATDSYDGFGIGFGVSDNFSGYLNTVLTETDPAALQETFNKVWQEEYAFYPGTGIYVQPRVFIYKKNVSGLKFNPSSEVIDLSEATIGL